MANRTLISRKKYDVLVVGQSAYADAFADECKSRKSTVVQVDSLRNGENSYIEKKLFNLKGTVVRVGYSVSFEEKSEIVPLISGLENTSYFTSFATVSKSAHKVLVVVDDTHDLSDIYELANRPDMIIDVFCQSGRLLSDFDSTVSEVVMRELAARRVRVHIDTTVLSVAQKGNDIFVIAANGSVPKRLKVDAVIVKKHSMKNQPSGCDLDIDLTYMSFRDCIELADMIVPAQKPFKKNISLPVVLHAQTDYDIFQVGINEQNAIERNLAYIKEIAVTRGTSGVGFVKLITTAYGRLLGASIQHDNARATIPLLSFACLKRMKSSELLSQLDPAVPMHVILADVINKI